MIPLSLAQIATITGAALDHVADPGVVVRGPVVIDSRRAGPGGLFAALRGERADGHDFAAAALRAGRCRGPGHPADRGTRSPRARRARGTCQAGA